MRIQRRRQMTIDNALHAHPRHSRGWLAVAAIVALIATHVWLFTTVSRAHVSLALGGVIAIGALKLAWWKRRR